jgi:hypothetical protein
MKKITLNLFSIDNWQELKFDYRLVGVEVEGGLSEGKDYHTAFNNAMKHLASVTRGVVTDTWHNGRKYIAVRSDVQLSTIVMPGSPLDITLTPLPQAFVFDGTAGEQQIKLAARFIENAIVYQLNRSLKIWNSGNNTFLKKNPVPGHADIQTDVYQGFKFRLHAQEGQIFVCLDLAYRYIDKQNLSQLLKHIPRDQWGRRVEGRSFLYQNGDDWYTVKGRQIGGTIGEQTLDKDGFRGTVYQYIKTQGKYAKARYPQPLYKQSETFYHTYSKNSSSSYAGAACLAKPIHFADNGLHKLSINDPHRRFHSIEYFIKTYFTGLRFAGKDLAISPKPELRDCEVIPIPGMRYAKNVILDPYQAEGEPGSELYLYPKRRRKYVYDNGLLDDEPYMPQYLFVPDNLPFPLMNALKIQFDMAMKALDKSFPGFELFKYSMKKRPYANLVCREFHDQVIQQQINGSCGIFVLPDAEGNGWFTHDLHQLLKKELFGVLNLKCINLKKVRRFFREGVTRDGKQVFSVPEKMIRDFKSYQVNTLFKYLIVNKKWPFALAKDLNHDLYIGIDAHGFHAGFVFLFKNGEKIVFDVEKTNKTTGTFRNEKINAGVIKRKIVEVLSRHMRAGEDFPKSIVILRDGLSFGEEQKALLAALKEMREQGVAPKEDIKLAVLEVAKSSAIPIRAAIPDRNNILGNADCGTLVYTEPGKDAYIFNTGYPYKVPGTSNPVHVSLAWGDIDFREAVDDVFAMTQLNFSAPDRPSSLPLPLKLIDLLIRDVSHENDYAHVQAKELEILENEMEDQI